MILAKALDPEDPRGLWIELFGELKEKDPTIKRHSILVPWSSILSFVLAEDFWPPNLDEAQKIDFTETY